MKIYFVCIAAYLVFGAIMVKPLNNTAQTNLVSKNISFSVYKSSSYKANIYNSAYAQVQIVVKKVNANGQHTIVWEKNIETESLKKYPTAENALTQNVTISNINWKNEYLLVDYTLIYKSKGSELKMHDSSIVKDNMPGKINISI